MKKVVIQIVCLVFITSFLYSQTEEKEKEYLSNQYMKNAFTTEKYRELADKWNETLSFFEGYPKLPFDTEKEQVVFENVLDLQEIPKKVIYDRIKEWVSINYGDISSVLHYESLLNGKIIIKGFFDVPYYDEVTIWFKEKTIQRSVQTNHTIIFTIKDDKVKIETTNIRYNFKTAGYWTGSYYSPEKINEISIHKIYPITSHPQNEWKSMGSLYILGGSKN